MAGWGEASRYYGTTAVCLLPCSERSGLTSAASRMSSRRSGRNVR
jgi:hypothetical protein